MEAYADATLKLSFKKLKPTIFFNFHYRMIHQYTLCISKVMQIICRGSKLFVGGLQCNSLSQVCTQAENSMTGRGYMGEVLIEVWLKSIKK